MLFIKKILSQTKGAVTIFVTMLLIPAMLVSGTAVDLARIYTGGSILQNANQLAANAVLSQYDALLYDLYGLFGIAENDPIFASLLDDYIETSIFGDSGQDTGLGTFQLFYGSNISLEDVYFAEGKHLRNEDVLSRQIEEFMKFRAPVVVVKEILELTGVSTLREDTGIINDKLELESAIARVLEMYLTLYNAIIAADRVNQVGSGGIAGVTVGTVSSALDRIRQSFIALLNCYIAWENAETPEDRSRYAAEFQAILSNISVRTTGGRYGSNWSNDSWGHLAGHSQGLNATIDNAIINADRGKPPFDEVVVIAGRLDAMQDDLRRAIDNLEARLEKGEGSPELRDALTTRQADTGMSIIDRYRNILRWDNIESMAIIYRDGGYDYIDNIVKPLLREVRYRNGRRSGLPSLSREQLENISSNGILSLSEEISAGDSLTGTLASYSRDEITYNMPDGFLRFGDYPGDNEEFFNELSQLVNQPPLPPVELFEGQQQDGGDQEESQRNMIDELLSLASSAYAGLTNNPLGAKYVNHAGFAEGASEDVSDISNLVSEASNHSVIDVISDPVGSLSRAGDYLLLLTYATSMFSNYTTARPLVNDLSRDDLHTVALPRTLKGTTLSPQVNYFFQSEWEYLYNGSENAGTNLSAITKLIFIVRIVCNYIAVFRVPEVTKIVTGIKAAFAWNPILSILLGELARGAFVAAESAIDLSILRSGGRVALIKNPKTDWIASPSGVARELSNLADGLASDTNTSSTDSDKGITYSNYMQFFFITKGIFSSNPSLVLTRRIADLIELNVINYQDFIFSDEERMSAALESPDRFRLNDRKTDFVLTTSADMRMLFLSMIFAQNFSNSRGIGMPVTMPVTATDFRGY